MVRTLAREIRQGRRNVGALKLSNLLQPDRFEEDFNIRRVRLLRLRRPNLRPYFPSANENSNASALSNTSAKSNRIFVNTAQSRMPSTTNLSANPDASSTVQFYKQSTEKRAPLQADVGWSNVRGMVEGASAGGCEIVNHG